MCAISACMALGHAGGGWGVGAAENSEKQLEYHKVQLLEAALMRVFRT